MKMNITCPSLSLCVSLSLSLSLSIRVNLQVLDDGTRHLPFQAESESDRDKQQSEILGIVSL